MCGVFTIFALLTNTHKKVHGRVQVVYQQAPVPRELRKDTHTHPTPKEASFSPGPLGLGP